MRQEAQGTALSAPYTIAFPFDRTVGPTIGAFLSGLREGRLHGVRASGGSILCPALEFDPRTGEQTGELVPLADHGTVRAWTWVRARADDVIRHGFAWALIAVDGAEGALFHAVDAGGDITRMATGMRVRARWRQDRVGDIRDIECFEPETA